MSDEPVSDTPNVEPQPAAAPLEQAAPDSPPEHVRVDVVKEPPIPAHTAERSSRKRPHPLPLAIARLARALWLGSGAFLLIAASAAFAAAGNTTDAANVVGAILTRWHYIALVAPLLLLFLEWRRIRPVMLILLFVAIVLASFQALLDTRIKMMRLDAFVPISSLSPDDPVRRQFGLLHGMSSLFLIGQVMVAAVAVAMREERDL